MKEYAIVDKTTGVIGEFTASGYRAARRQLARIRRTHDELHAARFMSAEERAALARWRASRA